mmetsp:Transcript_64423/g.134432  ORF Transcript_64423/g.134432 Transcript_64423/m.134432 type:complete len:119 (+) Transcript_64423:66-422(+)
MTKGKPALKATAQTNNTLPPWDGKKHTWPDFWKEAMKWVTTNRVVFAFNAARALVNRMQELQEDFKKRKKTFKPVFDAHDDKIWAEALQSRDNGGQGRHLETTVWLELHGIPEVLIHR